MLVWSCNFTWDHYFCKLIIYLFQYPSFRTGFHLYLKIQIEDTPFFRDFSSNTSSSDEFAIEAFFFDLITFKGADSVFSSFNRFRLGFKDVDGVVERLVETSVARRWQLVEVGVEKKSLEAIFAELSKKK